MNFVMSDAQDSERFRPLRPFLAEKTGGIIRQWEQQSDSVDPESLFHALLSDAMQVLASDVHLDPERDHYNLRMRVDGSLHDVHPLEQALGDRILNHFKVMADLNPVHSHKPEEGWIDYRFEDKHINLRVTCVPTVVGEKLSIRLLTQEPVSESLGGLGLGPAHADLIESWIENIRGMFLVVGAMGSGKTTTLYTLIDALRHRDRSIISIEDPVEYRMEGITQMQVAEHHDLNFAVGLKSIMRTDPDYIMLGEIRDPESAKASLEAASTGKVLLSTLHSRDAVGAVTSLRNHGVRDHEIAAVLEVVVAQRLVRKLCPECKVEKETASIDRNWLESHGREAPEKTFYAKGCDACRDVGYRGRTGIFEVWRVKDEVKEALLNHPSEQSLRHQIRDDSVSSLLDSACRLIETGATSIEEIRTGTGF